MRFNGKRAAVFGAALTLAGPCLAAAAQFDVKGVGTIVSRSSPLVGDRFTLRGQLESSEAPSKASIVQDGGRFALMARTVAVTQVCYNDTIFRDDFDADGG